MPVLVSKPPSNGLKKKSSMKTWIIQQRSGGQFEQFMSRNKSIIQIASFPNIRDKLGEWITRKWNGKFRVSGLKCTHYWMLFTLWVIYIIFKSVIFVQTISPSILHVYSESIKSSHPVDSPFEGLEEINPQGYAPQAKKYQCSLYGK